MNNEDNDSRFAFRFFVGMNILFVIGFILLVFLLCCESASALELVQPVSTVNQGSTTYYGYNLPTRPTSYDNNSQSRLNLGFSSYFTSNYSNIFIYNEKFYLRDLDNEVLDLMGTNNFTIPKVWTRNINFFDNYFSLNLQNQYLFSYGFDVGSSANTPEEMFENGNLIYYNGIFSYDYDLVVYNSSGVGDVINPIQNLCNIQVFNEQVSFSCTTSNYTFSYDLLVNNDNVKYYRFHVLFNSNSFDNFGFNHIMEDRPEVHPIYGVYGDNIIANNRDIRTGLHYTTDTYVFSEPFNIKYWSTNSSYTCSDKCWTQQDTDNNQLIYKPDDYLFENMESVINNFDYFGFNGIIHYTYDFIKDLLEDSNSSCVSLNVPILGKNITLPSSCTFWNRQDVSSFETFYHMFFLGIVCFCLGWKIYNDILKIYIPDSRVDDEVVKL